PDGPVSFITENITLAAGDPSNYTESDPSVGWFFMGSNQHVDFDFFTFTFTPLPASFTLYKPTAAAGFGSSHPSAMNILMCDGSVHTYPYGLTSLTQVINGKDTLSGPSLP